MHVTYSGLTLVGIEKAWVAAEGDPHGEKGPVRGKRVLARSGFLAL
jgi:hypothetical protein